MYVGLLQKDALRLRVDVEHDRPGVPLLGRQAAIVEYGQPAVAVRAYVVLPEELAPRAHREVRPLAVQPPDDVPGRALDSVNGPSVPSGDQYVSRAVADLGDRIDVEVVERRGRRPVAAVPDAELLVGLGQRYGRIGACPAVPLEQ